MNTFLEIRDNLLNYYYLCKPKNNRSMKLEYSISDTVLTIHESWQINSLRGMLQLLQTIRQEQADNDYHILLRTDRNIVEEWIVHNFFYDLHVLRLHTRTVDLEYPQRWYFRVAYHLVACINQKITRF